MALSIFSEDNYIYSLNYDLHDLWGMQVLDVVECLSTLSVNFLGVLVETCIWVFDTATKYVNQWLFLGAMLKVKVLAYLVTSNAGGLVVLTPCLSTRVFSKVGYLSTLKRQLCFNVLKVLRV